MSAFFAALILALAASPASAWEISSIRVAGETAAQIQLSSPEAPETTPALTIRESVVEFTLPGASLHSSFGGKLKLSAPHALIRTLSAVQDKKGVVVVMDVNGSVEGLKNRLRFQRDASGLALRFELPTKITGALELAKEEQQPLHAAVAETKPEVTGFGARQIFLILLVFAIAGVITYFVVRFLQTKVKASGNKKYLIESLAHCSLGNKTGVSLIRVGREFVLVGVTPNQVNLISALPALQAQYEEETRFERESFRDAVDEEIARLKKEIAL